MVMVMAVTTLLIMTVIMLCMNTLQFIQRGVVSFTGLTIMRMLMTIMRMIMFMMLMRTMIMRTSMMTTVGIVV